MQHRFSLLAVVWVATGVASLAGSSGCRNVTTQVPVNMDSAVVTHGDPVRAWEVRDSGRLAGSLVRYAEADHPARGFFSVRNVDQQVLGIIDLEGRAWRYRPHVKDPEWLGTGTVAQAAGWILGCSGSCELVEVSLDSLARDGASTLH